MRAGAVEPGNPRREAKKAWAGTKLFNYFAFCSPLFCAGKGPLSSAWSGKNSWDGRASQGPENQGEILKSEDAGLARRCKILARKAWFHRDLGWCFCFIAGSELLEREEPCRAKPAKTKADSFPADRTHVFKPVGASPENSAGCGNSTPEIRSAVRSKIQRDCRRTEAAAQGKRKADHLHADEKGRRHD